VNQFGCQYGVVITNLVMAFTQVSTADEYPVRSAGKTLQNERGVKPAGAHDPDGTQIRWVLIPPHPGRISRSVAAPVAQKAEYLWFV